MCSKVLLLVAACVAVCAGQDQGPAGDKKINPYHPIFLGKNPFRRNLPNDVETDLVEAFDNLDVIREDVNIMALETSNMGRDPQVIIDCFKAQKDLYYSIGKRIQELLRQASEEMSEELGDKYEAFAKKMSVPMNNIGGIMKTVVWQFELPQKMMELIEKQEFGKAMELMRASRRVYEENARMMFRIVRELRPENLQAAKKASRWAGKIRQESNKGMHMLRESFHRCVEEGGPKEPADSE